VTLRRVLLHYHIFKNAGTTVEDILAATFFDRFARFDKPEHEALVSSAEIVAFVEQNPAIQAVSSHQIRYPLPAAPGILFFDVCFLRDPLDRIRSSYDYFRIRPVEGNEVSDLANSLPLGEFLERLVDQHPWRLNDAQVNILAGRDLDDDPAGPAELEQALAVMLATPFLGVVDVFRESLTAGRHFLRPVFPHFNVEQPPANVSGGMQSTLEERIAQMRSTCKAAVWEEVLRLNALDRELVDRARAEILRRVGQGQALHRTEP
jgi:hypothetical protein